MPFANSIKWPLAAAGLLLIVGGLLIWMPQRGVVVYTSVDAEYAHALAKRFTQETGVPVVLHTDSEATKTTGLIQRLREMKSRPDGDVWWNSELSGTLLLAGEGLLQPYDSPQAAAIPDGFKDLDHLWTGFGLRARVLIYNTQRIQKDELPKTLEDLTDEKWRGRFCLARPLYGTTRSHLVSLVLALGEEPGLALLRQLRDNAGDKAWVLPGNSHVRDRVADGTYDLGLTDTDDVYSALRNKRPVDMVLIHQAAAWPGVYLIPNTASLIKGAPHPDQGRRFIDFLLKAETEAWLAQQGARQIPVRPGVTVPDGGYRLEDLEAAQVDYKKLEGQIEKVSVKIDRLLRGIDP